VFSKIKMLLYALGALAYLTLVGVAAFVNVYLGITLILLPVVYFVWRGFFSKRIALPIFQISKKQVCGFFTDAPQEEVQTLVQLGKEMGVEVSALLVSRPNSKSGWYKLIVSKSALTGKSKEFEFALKSLSSMLVAKGYVVVPIKDASQLDEKRPTGVEKQAHPILLVSGVDLAQTAFSVVTEFSKNFALICTSAQLLPSIVALYRKKARTPAILKFGYNFSFNAFEKSKTGFALDALSFCYGLSNETTLILVNRISKIAEQESALTPFTIIDAIDSILYEQGVSHRIADQLQALKSSLLPLVSYLGSDSSANLKTLLGSPLVIDLSSVQPKASVYFVAYNLAKWFVEREMEVVLECFDAEVGFLERLFLDAQINHRLLVVTRQANLSRNLLRSCETLVFLNADSSTVKIAKETLGAKLDEYTGKSFIFVKPKSITPLAVEFFEEKEPTSDEILKIVEESAPKIKPQDKPRLFLIFEKDIEKVYNALRYILVNSVVEEETVLQATGDPKRAQTIYTRLVQLGYLKRRQKAGIWYVELTQKGEEEFEKLESFLKD